MSASQAVVAVFALLVLFILPVAIVMAVLEFSWRKTRLAHETMLKLAEQGMAIPPELIAPPTKSPASDLKVGIVLVAAGIGIGLFFLEINGPKSIGGIPMLIGVGYIIAWIVERFIQPRN